jgi:transposase
MKITTIGVDLAKNVFQVHGVDARGKAGLKKQLKRAQVLPFFANLAPGLIGMEACAGAHYWARKLEGLGHTVKLMPPQYVKPYVKSNKNDAADAEAICEAVGRPNMRFVPIKSASQQAILAVHRARQAMVKARTAQANQIRGLLGEFGIVIPIGIASIGRRLPDILEDGDNELPGSFRELLSRLQDNLEWLQRQVDELQGQIARWHHDSEASQRLAQSGGKTTLLGMSKRGDCYVRTLLIHGARSVVAQAVRQPARADAWLRALLARRPKNVVAVALANKNARIAWALLRHARGYDPQFATAASKVSAGVAVQ